MSKRSESERLVRRLREAGHEAYLAGGCVRDLILGREPNDYDVATSARPEEVRALFSRTVPVGAQFGVVLVIVDDEPYEVATFRSDGPYDDGRRPRSVVYSGAEEDARRRDFTINGLFLDPETGEIVDFVAGRPDIEARVIRAIGEPRDRFREDRLRLLRAVRFAASLGFTIEPETRRAIEEEAPAITVVSAERIRDEIIHILTEGGAERGFRLLLDLGLLEVVLPEVAAMVGVEQPPEFHPEGDVWTHLLLVLAGLDRMDSPGLELAFGALLHDVGKPPTFEVSDRIRFNEHASVGAEIARRVCRDLRLSRAETDRVSDLVGGHMRFMEIRRMRPAKLRRFLTSPDVRDHLDLHRLDCEASHGDTSNLRFCEEKLEEIAAEPEPLRPLLTGHDLIDQGFTPGPVFAKILETVEEAQLEQRISSREEALRLVRDHYGDPRDVDLGGGPRPGGETPDRGEVPPPGGTPVPGSG